MAKYNRVHEHLNLKSDEVFEVEHSLAMNAMTTLTASRIPWLIAARPLASRKSSGRFRAGDA